MSSAGRPFSPVASLKVINSVSIKACACFRKRSLSKMDGTVALVTGQTCPANRWSLPEGADPPNAAKRPAISSCACRRRPSPPDPARCGLIPPTGQLPRAGPSYAAEVILPIGRPSWVEDDDRRSASRAKIAAARARKSPAAPSDLSLPPFDIATKRPPGSSNTYQWTKARDEYLGVAFVTRPELLLQSRV